MNRPPSPHRYRLHRAGIRNVWQYDHQEFTFGEGRLLLRGKNGAGKSKALEMLLPYLLDGDARALDATGTGRTTLAWLMLDGFARTNRLGYLWLEFARTDEEGDEQHLTVGAAVRASQSTRTARPFFFTTRLRVGEDLDLAPAGQPLPVDRLKTLVGPENVTDRAVEHRARVARDLFGLTDPARYRNLLHLLHRLRRPTIGDRIDSGGLVQVLAETLPALDDEVVEKVARSLDDLDSVRAHLGRLERTDRALRTFLTGYRGYLHGALRRRTDRAGAELERLREHRRAAGDAARTAEELRGRERDLDARIDRLVAEREAAGTDLAALHASAGYRSLRELGEKRATVTALHSAAGAAFRAVRQAHLGEEEAGRRLTAEAARLGAELVDLSTAHAESVREAERAGLDPVHLGEPVATPAAPVAPATTVQLTAPDGDFHLVRHSEVRAVDTGICATALHAWDARLDAVQPVIRNRVRFVTELAALIERSNEARREADEADAAREHLEDQVEHARTRAEQCRRETAHASKTYAEEAGAWTGRLRELTGLPLDEVLAPLAHDPSDGPLSARTPDEVAETARSAVEPWLAALGEERDTLALAVRALETERDDLRRRREEWERRADPEPPPPPHRAALRAPGTGAPLYRLVDFVPGLPPDARAGVEAALEASGLLDAWVHADGTALDPATHDTLLVPGAPVAGPSLTRVLRPVDAPDSGVTAEQVQRLLESVALAEDAAAPHTDPHTAADTGAHTAAGADGSWRLGVARGRHLKQAAEYVGAEVRAETRRRALADLDRRLADADATLEERRQALRALTDHRDRAGETLRRPPSPRGLTDAWARTAEVEGAVTSLTARASTAAREAQRARARAVAARRETEATANAQDLPADPAALETVRLALDRLGRGTQYLRRRMRVVLDTVEGHRGGRTDHEHAVAARREAETDYAEPLDRLETARRTVRALEEALGATEQEILAHEAEAKRRLDAVGRQLPRLRDDRAEVHDLRVRAEEDDRRRREALAAQEDEVLACGRRLRTALALPGLLRGAGLDAEADEGALKSPDPVHHDVRERLTALDRLTGAVRRGLDAERHDLSDTALLNRHTELRDQLSGGYDATLEEHDGIKLCRLVNDQGPSDVARVGERIAAEAAEARDRLTERESEVFQRFLAGELGDHLSAQVLAAGALVTALNTTLATVRTSHGLGVTLDWKLADGVEADVKAAVDLLRSPAGLRTREQSEQLRDVLQRRIEDARRADPAAGYAAHLRTALDYRGWFTFTPWVVDDAAPGSRRKLSGRTGLSQGEQRVLSYLVLFAAAAAHFTGLADAAPHTPRLILLDDAFAKVDEPTHARLGRILVDLDLDFVLTSERLIGNWPDVPSLHIYECLRDPHVRGVATLHYTWNGRQRRLMPV
ncbi:TIGR02680 family protein [Streptomyces sp. NPDC051740]|uniref:TIGR02680 family protein n=1 Tax=Streptomyces sp. NPDC051740 TaxID=3365673 RepID=UPI0037916AC0